MDSAKTCRQLGGACKAGPENTKFFKQIKYHSRLTISGATSTKSRLGYSLNMDLLMVLPPYKEVRVLMRK